MKTIKKTIVAVIIIYCSYSQAQQAYVTSEQELALQKQTMRNTPFIFEGTVIKQQCYISKKRGTQTCTVVQITKIFKGNPQIKLGTIKVIMQGGHIGDTPYIPPSEAGTTFKIGLTYIVFGNPATSSIMPNSTTDTLILSDNTVILEQYDLIEINLIDTNLKDAKRIKELKRYNPNWLADWDNYHFYSLDVLYAYLKQNGNLTVQEEVQQQPKSPADSTKQK
jgi:hypothetical protein